MIFLKCPICRGQNKLSNKKCSCGQNLDAARKNSSAVYYIEYRLPGGRKVREKVGTSYKEAVAAEGKRLSQKAEGKILEINKDAKQTFNEVAEWFKQTPRFQSLKSKYVLEINLNSFLSQFGGYPINSLTKLNLENYQIKRRKAGKSDSYIDQEIGAARNMLNTAYAGEIVSGNAILPFKQTKKLLRGSANARDVIISFPDLQKILSALPPHARNIVEVAFLTGMRRGEIVKLTWDKINLESRIITLEREDTKTSEKRVIPISDRLYEILQNIPRSFIVDKTTNEQKIEPHVFLYHGAPVKCIRSALRVACEKVGLPYGRNVKNGITFHDLRHTFTTNMRRSGVHDTVTMAITGHKTREMFDRYNSVELYEQRNGILKMEKFIDNGSESKSG